MEEPDEREELTEELDEREELVEEPEEREEDDPQAFTSVSVLVMRFVVPDGAYLGSATTVIFVPAGQVFFVDTRNDAIAALY